MRILIAEDDIVSLTLLQATLVMWGYEVVSVTNGTDALEQLQRDDAPLLAILDVGMPGMEGTEVCRQLRETSRPTPTYLILLTANAGPEAIVAGFEAGADDYVTKPFESGELEARIKVGVRMVKLQGSLAESIRVLQNTFSQLERKSATLNQLNGQMLKEIADRTRAEEELRLLTALTESQRQRLNSIVATVPGLVWEAWRHPDPANQRIDFVSDYVAAMLGYSVAEWLSTPNFWLSIVHPDDQAHAREAAVNFASRTNCATEFRWLAKDGRVIWVETHFIVISDAEGRPVCLRGVTTDISERKRAEVELRETAERYRLLFENNPHPMWVYDLETLSFSAVNEAAIQRYGYSREEFLALTVKDIRPPEDVPALLENVSKLNGGIDKAGIWKHQKKDGGVIDVEITSHEFVFAGRRSELVLANDVTERRKLEVQLRQAQKLESMGQLAAGIAHEINTPTQYVGDNLRFIQEAYHARTAVMEKYGELFAAAQLGPISAGQLDEVRRVIEEADLEYVTVEVPKALKQSLEGIERIAKIVQSMKDFAHPDSMEKKAADLNRAIESTINVARGEWKYVAEMETDFDLSLPPVPCLLGELNQMTLNMIINSAHAIADKMRLEGEGKGLIKISTRHEGDWAVMRISDTGAGIPLAIRARVFDPFFTTKEVGKGTGQGLAISHAVVEKHGGNITFETAEGEGTTFIIRLPLHEIAATPDGLKAAA